MDSTWFNIGFFNLWVPWITTPGYQDLQGTHTHLSFVFAKNSVWSQNHVSMVWLDIELVLSQNGMTRLTTEVSIFGFNSAYNTLAWELLPALDLSTVRKDSKRFEIMDPKFLWIYYISLCQTTPAILAPWPGGIMWSWQMVPSQSPRSLRASCNGVDAGHHRPRQT